MAAVSARKIQTFEDLVLARLRARIPVAPSAFNPFPETRVKKGAETAFPEVEFYIGYIGGKRGKTVSTHQVISWWTMRFQINIRARNRRYFGSQRGAYDYMEAAIEALQGWVASEDYEAIEVGDDDYLADVAGIWEYGVEISTKTVCIGDFEEAEEVTGGALRKVTFHDDYGNTEIVEENTYEGEGNFDEEDPQVP